jgi:hypothetical protein
MCVYVCVCVCLKWIGLQLCANMICHKLNFVVGWLKTWITTMRIGVHFFL